MNASQIIERHKEILDAREARLGSEYNKLIMSFLAAEKFSMVLGAEGAPLHVRRDVCEMWLKLSVELITELMVTKFPDMPLEKLTQDFNEAVEIDRLMARDLTKEMRL